MANRYWVGGTATWDNLALLKWSTTSGGIGGSAVPTTADTVFFDAASGANTVTIGAGVATCSTLTMTGFTGTLAFGTNSITCAGTGTIYTGATTFSVTGTPLILCTNSSGTGRTISPAATTEANSISFNISAGTGLVAFTTGQSVKNLNFTGFTGTLSNTTRTIYGNLTLVSGMTLNAGTGTATFAATSGTQTITSATQTIDFPVTFSGTATYQLVDAMTVGTSTNRTVTLTTGTLDLNDNTFTIFGVFSSSNTNTRAISFGTSGKFVMTSSNTTLWSVGTVTSLTMTGTNPLVEYSGNITTATTRTIANASTGGGEATAVSFNITAGTDTIANNSGSRFKNLNYTGFAGTITNDTRNIYGNLIIPSGATITAGASVTTFAGTSGTQSVTTNANTLDFPLTINGVGGTVQLVDALTMGSTRTLTLTNGTFNSNAKSVTCGAFSGNNSNTKTFTITNSTFTVLSGTSTSGFLLNPTGTTYNVTGSNVVFTTSTAAQYWGGGGSTFPQITMSGTGQLIIGASGSTFTITTLSNTVQPCTVSIISTNTQLNVTNFNLSGTAGNLVTFNSSVAGTARTISKTSGTVNALYLNVQDSTATGGAKWYANSSNDLGNNTGWNIFNNSFLQVF